MLISAIPGGILEKAFELAIDYLVIIETKVDDSDPRPATHDEIIEFFVDYAYEELGYTKDALGRWEKP